MDDQKFPGGCYFPVLYSTILSLPHPKTSDQALIISIQLDEEANRLDSLYTHATKAIQLLRSSYLGTTQHSPSTLDSELLHLLLKQNTISGYSCHLEDILLHSSSSLPELSDQTKNERLHFFVLGSAKSEYFQNISISNEPAKLYNEVSKIYLEMAQNPESLRFTEIDCLIENLDE